MQFTKIALLATLSALQLASASRFDFGGLQAREADGAELDNIYARDAEADDDFEDLLTKREAASLLAVSESACYSSPSASLTRVCLYRRIHSNVVLSAAFTPARATSTVGQSAATSAPTASPVLEERSDAQGRDNSDRNICGHSFTGR